MFSNYPTTVDQKSNGDPLRGEGGRDQKNHRNPLTGNMVGLKLVKIKDHVSKERPLS